MLLERFVCLFREEHIPADPAACQAAYEDFLCVATTSLRGRKTSWPTWLPNTGCTWPATGTARVQESRLKKRRHRPVLQQVFISQKLGPTSPARPFFHRCFAQIPDLILKALMIGDSLTSDIRGAKGAGIVACWFNPGRKRLFLVFPWITRSSLPQLREFL